MFKSRIAFWCSKGLDPKVIYDIGANVGDWTRDMQKFFPNAHYELFEANIDNKNHLKNYNYHIVLLGDREANNIPFYKIIKGFNTGNSIYLEVSKAFKDDNYKTDILEMITLNKYIPEKNLPIPDLVKLDVQGAELDILKGMSNYIQNVKHFIIEASLHRWNKDAPMIENIIKYMYDNNFYFVDVLELHIVNGYTLQIDILFSHESTQFRREDFY